MGVSKSKPIDELKSNIESRKFPVRRLKMAQDGTKLIPLTQGQFAIVDAEDYDRLSQHRWYAQKQHGYFYATRMTSRKGARRTLRMHREILQAAKGTMCDHIDHNGLNNCKSNLRLCTSSQNQQNQKARRTSSAYKGVCRRKDCNRWAAQIGFQCKRIHIGLFDDQMEAALAYDRKASELFDEFACLNFQQLIEFRKWLKKLIWAA